MTRVLLVALFGGTLSACDFGDGPTAPGAGTGMVSLTLMAGGTAAGSGGGTVASPDTVRLSGDVLVLTSLELVLRRIELEREDADDCPEDSGRDDDCEKVVIGPMLVDLSPGGGPARVVRVAVPAGVYDEIEFEVHKPDDDSAEDRAFLQAHPDLRRVSIRVRGSFNGQPFTWITDLNEEQEIELFPPLVVETGGDTELVLMVDVRSWFRAGGRLVDPVTALKGQPNENLVRDNVRRSFRAFERDD